MFKPSTAVMTDSKEILFVKTTQGQPVAYINLELVRKALFVAGFDIGSLDAIHENALVELIQYMKDAAF